MQKLPQDRFYTCDDLWVRAEGDVWTLGMSDFGQNELGELVFVELPALNHPVRIGQSVAVVESVKSVSEVSSPLEGMVIEANPRVGQTPELVNDSPYDEGWIVRIQSEEPPENLLSPAQYAAWRRLPEL
ncbi:glycine cleavage system H protein [Abditibacteriota bacterium]|nr:glycine cleavage system H protein [Abditibacteriota bacterium]